MSKDINEIIHEVDEAAMEFSEFLEANSQPEKNYDELFSTALVLVLLKRLESPNES